MDLITLRAGGAGLVLAPAAGGAVVRYWIDDDGTSLDLLRPWTAPGQGDRFLAAAFPLVPYSNRIRAGRFSFQGREIALPLNRPPERHSIHGHGWQVGWIPLESGPHDATLEYRHAADSWPWPYRARQRFALGERSVSVELSLTNEIDAAMPAGLGWHPYFARTPRTTLTASVEAMWRTDHEVMPTMLSAPPPELDPTRGVTVDGVGLDNCFTGWRRRAVIERPEDEVRLTMTAEPPLDFLVVYTPPGRPFFCAEPVSHITDAFNMAATGRTDTGMRILAPGETLRAKVTLSVEHPSVER